MNAWIHPTFYHNINAVRKNFGVSFLCSSKAITEGHLLRQKLWYRQKDIKIPKWFWLSSALPIENIDNNPILPKDPYSKSKLFNCQFHIAIENVKANNYFTEKL